MFKVTFCRSRFLFPYPEVTGNHERAQSKEPERHAGLTVRRSSEPQGRRPFLICYSGRECLLGSWLPKFVPKIHRDESRIFPCPDDKIKKNIWIIVTIFYTLVVDLKFLISLYLRIRNLILCQLHQSYEQIFWLRAILTIFEHSS